MTVKAREIPTVMGRPSGTMTTIKTTTKFTCYGNFVHIVSLGIFSPAASKLSWLPA